MWPRLPAFPEKGDDLPTTLGTPHGGYTRPEVGQRCHCWKCEENPVPVSVSSTPAQATLACPSLHLFNLVTWQGCKLARDRGQGNLITLEYPQPRKCFLRQKDWLQRDNIIERRLRTPGRYFPFLF